MARILTNLIGDLRGSIGGITYSRNAGGAYARQRVKPVNPQSVRQMVGRYRFGGIAQLYRGLEPEQKDGWEVFARNLFNPLRRINTGNARGLQAFMSLRQSAGQGNQYPGTVSFKSGSTIAEFDTIPYDEQAPAPTAGITATLSDGTLMGQQISARNVAVADDGSFRIALTLPGFVVSPTHPVTVSTLQSDSGIKYGIGLYISSVVNAPSLQPATRLNINLGDTGIFDDMQATGGGVFEIKENLTALVVQAVDPVTTKDFPQAGNWVIATPFLRGIDGQMKLLGPSVIQVQEGPLII